MRNFKILLFILCLGILVSCSQNKSNIKEKELNSTYTELKLDYENYYMASTFNNKMYLPVSDNTKERLPNKLLAYNFSNQTEETIFHSKMGSEANIQGYMLMKNGYYGWIPMLLDQNHSIRKNLSNDKENQIHKTNEIIEPYLYKHYVSWMEINEGQKCRYYSL